jgi:hypothetical protein
LPTSGASTGGLRCNNDVLYFDTLNTPLGVTHGGGSWAYALMCGPLISRGAGGPGLGDLGNNATGQILSTDLAGGTLW